MHTEFTFQINFKTHSKIHFCVVDSSWSLQTLTNDLIQQYDPESIDLINIRQVSIEEWLRTIQYGNQ